VSVMHNFTKIHGSDSFENGLVVTRSGSVWQLASATRQIECLLREMYVLICSLEITLLIIFRQVILIRPKQRKE